MNLKTHARSIRDRIRDVPAWQKAAFAIAATAIMLLGMAAQVQDQSARSRVKGEPDSHFRVIDLDFVTVGDGLGTIGFVSAGPLGQVELGSRADHRLLSYSYGSRHLYVEAAGTTFEGLEGWDGRVGHTSPTVEGVKATYGHFYPSTDLEVVSGIDGTEMFLVVRSAPFVGRGNLTYSFWVNPSPGLLPVADGKPVESLGPGPHVVQGGIPIANSRGQAVFQVTPALALMDYRTSPTPADSRAGATYESYFPSHQEGDREVVPLDYEVEVVDGRMKLSVLVPTELFWDPALKWPVRIDPGITNPISNSSYFSDETILMDSDLVVTSSGAAQFSNVSLVFNRTSAPNWNLSVEAGGSITFLQSHVYSNDSEIPYAFSVAGTMTAQDTLIEHTTDGVTVSDGNVTLSNVTLTGMAGRGLVLGDSTSTIQRLEVTSPAGTGIHATDSDIQGAYVNVTGAGAEGLYLNGTSGNLTFSHITGSTLNGAMVVSGSGINITNSEFSGSNRNGVIVIGSEPSIENCSITGNGWSGVVLFDDHASYMYGNWIADNNWSGVEVRLNSTANMYSNTIQNNTVSGIRVIASDPNIELNTIRENDIGAWLEGAHNGDAKPGDDGSTESNYDVMMTASSELGAGEIIPLVAGVSIVHQGSDTDGVLPTEQAQFTMRVTNTDDAPPPTLFDLSIDSDESSWASLSVPSVTLDYGEYEDVTLTVSVPPSATPGTTYDVKVWVNSSAPPFPQDSVWAYVEIENTTTLAVDDIETANNTAVWLTATLMEGATPVDGETVAFKVDGSWVGENATNATGVATVQVTAVQPPTSQQVDAYFNGSQYKKESSGSGYLNITWTDSLLEAPAATGRWGDPTDLTVRLLSSPAGTALIGRTVHFTLNGTYLGQATTNTQGYGTWLFQNAIEPSVVTWNASFDGDTYTGASSNSTNFTSLTDLVSLAAADITIRQGENANLSTVLTDDEGYAMAGRTVTFKRGSTTLGTDTTDSGGAASLEDTAAASLEEGDYSMTYVFAGEDHYATGTGYYTLTVRRWVTTFNVSDQSEPYGDTVDLVAQLLDEDASPLASKSVGLYLDETLLDNVTTNATGWAVYSDTANRAVGTYDLRFEFYGDTRNEPLNTTVNLTVVRETTVITVVVDAEIQLGDVLNITLTLTDDESNPLSKFINVTLLGGIYANGTTDGSGVLYVEFDSRGLIPKRYVLWYFFDGDDEYAPGEGYTRIVVKYDADLYGNTIEDNTGTGVLANNSSSKLVGNLIRSNDENLVVSNGSLLVYNSSVGLSTTADFRLGEGGSIYSTNTTFSRGKVEFDSGAVLLHVRWYLNLLMLDPSTREGYEGLTINVTDIDDTLILSKATDEDGWFGEEAITEYTANASSKDYRTFHRTGWNDTNLTVMMDVSRNMTMFIGDDGDLDGILNEDEPMAGLWWLEAETHVVEYTQIVDDSNASGGQSVFSLDGDGRFTDDGTFPPFEAGTYTVMFRGRANTTGGTVRVVVTAANATELANDTVVPNDRYRWFTAPVFDLESEQELLIALTDESGDPEAVGIQIDEIVVVLLEQSGQRVNAPGQVVNIWQPDTDDDGGLDGAEVREFTYWYEAETLAVSGADRVSDPTASNSWTVGHADGNDTILTFNDSVLGADGVYVLLIRGEGNVTVNVSVDGGAAASTPVELTGYEPGYQAFRFNYNSSATLDVSIHDADDGSPGLDDPQSHVDKVGMVLEMKRPVEAAYATPATPTYNPKEKATPVYLGPAVEGVDTPSIVWVGKSNIFLGTLDDVLDNGTFVPVMTKPFGVDPEYDYGATQPILYEPDDGTAFKVATTVGTEVQMFQGPALAEFTFNTTTHVPADGSTINPLAYGAGWLAFSSEGGFAYGIMDTSSGLVPGFHFTPGLGAGVGAPTIYHDKIYYGFEYGLVAVAYNISSSAEQSWYIGNDSWPDPRDHCPIGIPGCPAPGFYPLVNRTFAGAVVNDVGNLFALVYNETETDLVSLTEDGEFLWSIDLGWDNYQPDTDNVTAPRLALRNNAIAVAGPTLKVFDRDTGALLMGHDFGYNVSEADLLIGPVMSDREIIVPGPDGIYFLAYPEGAGWGDEFGTDLNQTFNATYNEDILWRIDEDELVNRQLLMGDFDGSGYRDLLYQNDTGFVFLKDFEVAHRNIIEYAQVGMDASHDGNAEYVWKFVATDPLDPDMDADGLGDGFEVGGSFAYQVIQAEDATDFQAWSDSPVDGEAKNYNFFHQTGVTLTADDGTVALNNGSSISWIRFNTTVDESGHFTMTLVPNTQISEIVDLRYAVGDDADPGTAETTGGYGAGAYLEERKVNPKGQDLFLTEDQETRLTQMVENATYLKVRYVSLDPDAEDWEFTEFGVKHAANVNLVESFYDPNTRQKMWVTVFIKMDIEFDLFVPTTSETPRNFEFELGLNLSLVPDETSMGGSSLPEDLAMLRVLDLDRLELSRRGLNPHHQDTDGDGLADGSEWTGLPWAADTDHDGLSDSQELENGTDPTDRDTDHDGIRDGVELGLTGNSTGWASIPEWIAVMYQGDPHLRPPKTDRYLPNYDADPNTTTDPLDPDSDDDGIPDGWVDGWIYDPSWLIGQIRHETATTEYLRRAAPIDYNVSYWHQSGVYDSFPQIWEGEDGNLDGAVNTSGNWTFCVSMGGDDGDATDASCVPYARKGSGETDPTNEDSDGDGVPEGYEIWYSTRDPVWNDTDSDGYPDEDAYYFTPVDADGGVDGDRAYSSTARLKVDPNGAGSSTVEENSSNLSEGIQLPAPSSPSTPLLLTKVRLNLSAERDATPVTLEVWQDGATSNDPERVLVWAEAIVFEDQSWVEFDVDSAWMNFGSNNYFVVLASAGSNITWYGGADQSVNWFSRNETGVWTNATPGSFTPSVWLVDYASQTGDGLTNLEEYLVGSNPKVPDTDAGTGGVESQLGDAMNDGDEMINHTIFRTNADFGALVSTNYDNNSWILIDESLETADIEDWLYFQYIETEEEPNETFAGAKNLTTFFYMLQDGSEVRLNMSDGKVYLYLPGSDFEDLVEETNLTNVTNHYEGTARVFYQGNASAVDDAYKTNALFPNESDPWLFRFKQLFATDPFDWDTDDDGLADGWEYYVSGFGDTDGDGVPDVRDFDSDNDGLTDGQEMLQIVSDWTGESGTDAANLKFDPDGDGLYAMRDTDSDGDGIPDAAEVLWSVDTDGDNRINLVDWDSDNDGLCDGWCTSASTTLWRTNITTGVPGWYIDLPPGMPNGEDTNENGTNEQGESSPVKYDTDGDGLHDGYTLDDAGDWLETQVEGRLCPGGDEETYAYCGENSTYDLYDGTYTSPTNRTNPDSDGDGLTDKFEVVGWAISYWNDQDEHKMNRTVGDPNTNDTDGDGLLDPTELSLGTNLTETDTDFDLIADGTEDENRDGFRQNNETSAILADSDGDGIADGTEDFNQDGIKDADEPDPLDWDTDDDGIPDGVEFLLMKDNESSWTISHDFDGDGLTDLNDPDSDNDGLDDAIENWNRDSSVLDENETNPYNPDTDGDGLWDGAEPMPWDDIDNDTLINALDTNSNADGLGDAAQVWVVFRTNAVAGDYADSDVWVALIAPDANPYTPEDYDYSAGSALYRWAGSLESPAGATQVLNPYGVPGEQIDDWVELKTPEGYAVYKTQNSTNWDIYLQVSAGQFELFTKDGTPPGDWDTGNRSNRTFLANHQEVYDGRAATSLDPDFDGVSTIDENKCGLDPNDNDTDDDGILDGLEYRACADFDSDGKPDANDSDSDGDGVTDGLEDANLNGVWDAGETDALATDTDNDGLADGAEDADLDGSVDATESDPRDRDTDDDGISDYDEVHGTWCYPGQGATCGDAYGARIILPYSADSDGDGLMDGQEIGLTSPGSGTDTDNFVGDDDPSTTTDPNEVDTDGDGIEDGTEDLDLDGVVDSGEADPQAWDTDGDGLCDGKCSGVGEDLNLNGYRDQDSEEEWNETDFLANDSDVDGILDGAEVNGTYCLANETGPCSHPALDALVADSDGDGLRDGQETAGWTVGVWYERTMDKKENYSVASNPWSGETDTDGDGLTDFEEFMNGSDPGSGDTDGDGILDWDELDRGSNITGVEGTPPQIENVQLQVGIAWEWFALLYLPSKAQVTVSFDISDNVGLSRVSVTLTRWGGQETRLTHFDTSDPGSYTTSASITNVFEFSIFDALVSGGDVNITAYDVNENGASGEFHVDSVLEAIAKAIEAFLEAIVNVIVEALSFLGSFFLDLIKAMLQPVMDMLKTTSDSIRGEVDPLVDALGELLTTSKAGSDCEMEDECASLVQTSVVNFFFTGAIWEISLLVAVVLQGIQWLIFGMLLFVPGGMAVVGGLGSGVRGIVQQVGGELAKGFFKAVTNPWLLGAGIVGAVLGGLLDWFSQTDEDDTNNALGLAATGFIVALITIGLEWFAKKSLTKALEKVGVPDVIGQAMAVAGGWITVLLAVRPDFDTLGVRVFSMISLVISVLGWIIGFSFNSILDDTGGPLGVIDELVSSISMTFGVLTFLANL